MSEPDAPDAAAGPAAPREPAGTPAPAEPSASAVTMAATPEVAPVDPESVLPGAHRGGFQRLPTAPLEITSATAPHDPDGEQPAPEMQWLMPEPRQPARGMSGWALAFGILALFASLFVGWGFPLGIVAIVAAILALRRPLESRGVAVWAIVLGGVSILYSAGWLLFAATSAGLIR
ncbi:DUF4190 domain-containing protein [Microbacterium sp. SS28]|uniref:DUF4190 domain-containing protein n=1 Tax=Microbacterium sp. SS28 TaxID=2919948 RepID=UPI001FAA9278|nr:DUF4190 domain-containing protein [Microbacterium sp. SS28]